MGMNSSNIFEVNEPKIVEITRRISKLHYFSQDWFFFGPVPPDRQNTIVLGKMAVLGAPANFFDKIKLAVKDNTHANQTGKLHSPAEGFNIIGGRFKYRLTHSHKVQIFQHQKLLVGRHGGTKNVPPVQKFNETCETNVLGDKQQALDLCSHRNIENNHVCSYRSCFW